MLKKRRALLSVQFFSSVGNAMVGVFLPFLLMRSFDLTMVGVLFIIVSLFMGMALVVFPVQYFLSRKFSSAKVLQIGILLHALFYLALSLGNLIPNGVILAVILYVLALMVYWPMFHAVMVHTTKNVGRGGFNAKIQILMVGANIVAPVITGILLDNNLDQAILGVSIFFFLLAIFTAKNLVIPKETLPSRKKTWQLFRQFFCKRSNAGFWAQGLQDSVLWMVWPLFLGSVLEDFALMGMIVGAAALVEMISSKIIGHFTDKKSPAHMLKIGIWVRIVDVGARSLLMFWPYPVVAGILALNAGALGPIFNISWASRMYDLSEECDHRKDVTALEFFVVREFVLALSRSIMLIGAAGFVYFFGILSVGWIFMLAGVVGLLFRWQR